ncbi:hypothetical protein WJX72_010405 [[Myrmecia] bisecta]|uniref:WPP domain-containing protein n=1 Tax=[Myrmecia] bisecta TaxID=41462 RepID=A0AAW1P5W6_9CHLO
MAEDWSLTEEDRKETVDRIRNNIATLGFTHGKSISEDQAARAAVAIEKKAYTVARVEARTTTGIRPHAETFKAYTRKLAQLVLDVARQDGAGQAASAGSNSQAEGLDLTGEREFLTRETAEEVLAPVLASGAAISKVKFSTKSFGSDAAGVAAKAIENVRGSLTDADMSDIIAGRPEDEALAALRIISGALAACALRALDLSDNALGEKGVRACAAAISGQAALQSLKFQNVGCSIKACQAVQELVKNAGQLRTFHFYNNMSDNEGAAAIAQVLARAPMMEDFRMGSSRVGAEGGIALAQGLAASQQLIKLDLRDNPMTSEVASALADTLRSQQQLRVLYLADTSLCDEGVTEVAEALAESAPDLEELDLSLNEITPDGASAVAACIARKNKLQKLTLRENELEDRGALTIARALAGLQALRAVDLCQNQIRRGGATALAKAVADKTALELLALDENEISESGIDAVKDILEDAGKLAALGPLDDNDADAAEDEDEDDGRDALDVEDELSAAMAKSGIK